MRETLVRFPGWEDPPEEGMATHSSTLCLENPMDRGAWWAMVYGIAKSWTQLSDEHHIESPALGARKIGKVSV